MSERVRSRSPVPARTASTSIPNWLACATCSAPIVTRSELIAEEVSTLKNAVYADPLEMLEKDVTVYSATNTADHRFDVVRAVLDETVSVPTIDPAVQEIQEKAALQTLLSHFQGLRNLTADSHGESTGERETPARALAEMEAYVDGIDEESPSEEETVNEPGVEEIICGRIHTLLSPTEEYSWFPAFSWTIASCANCGGHLGWVFWTKDGDEATAQWKREFLSLVVTRLREKIILDDSNS